MVFFCRGCTITQYSNEYGKVYDICFKITLSTYETSLEAQKYGLQQNVKSEQIGLCIGFMRTKVLEGGIL